MRRRATAHELLILAILVSLPSTTGHVWGQQAVTLEHIEKAWKEREERIRTAHFEWTESRTYGKGTMTGMAAKAKRSAVPAPYPPEDVIYTLRQQVSMDERRTRYVVDGYRFSGDEGEFTPGTYWSVFDGIASGMYFGEATDRPTSNTNHRLGFITKIDRTENIHTRALWPVLVAYRPLLVTEHLLSPGQWRLTGEEGIIEGRTCVLLRKSLRRIEAIWWLDPNRDCTVLRCQSAVDGSVCSTLDISYKQDSVHGYVPSRWSSTDLIASNMSFDTAATGNVTMFKLNAPIDDMVFTIQFPVDTWVEDGLAGTKYIIRENGEKRTITAEELGAVLFIRTYFIPRVEKRRPLRRALVECVRFLLSVVLSLSRVSFVVG